VAVLETMGTTWEVIFVDDGSRDRTVEIVREANLREPRVKLVRFRRNFGQTAALAAGFDFAAGKIVVTMDGDLQNDPADIPRLVAKRGGAMTPSWGNAAAGRPVPCAGAEPAG
jgi:glycosyltransferase involved in cell wall biosynthesis